MPHAWQTTYLYARVTALDEHTDSFIADSLELLKLESRGHERILNISAEIGSDLQLRGIYDQQGSPENEYDYCITRDREKLSLLSIPLHPRNVHSSVSQEAGPLLCICKIGPNS